MKHINNIFITLAIIILASSCTEMFDFKKRGNLPEGTPIEIDIPFNANANTRIEVISRATQSEEQEKNIYNIYLMIFDSEGKKIYSHLFDNDNLSDTSKDNYWTTNNTYSGGTLHISTIAKSGCTIYAITNISPIADIVNISPERLQLVQTKSAIDSITATMNQLETSRTGRFPMTGTLTDQNTQSLAGKTIELKRLDAKVIFNVEFDGTEIKHSDGTSTRITSFEPDTWQVFNLPQSCYIFEHPTDCPNRKFFDGDHLNFETELEKGGNFSFYMLENRNTSAENPGSQAEREKQYKNSDGSNGNWRYAPATSTYVKFTGRIILSQKDAAGNDRMMDADVRYTIHLGDFSNSKYDNYSINRNNAYTYNVTIKGVNDIRTEVHTDSEPAPGAEGDVRVVSENIYDCDSHYSSQVITFNADNINSDNITWYVKTPFCEGEPKDVNGVDDATGLDYKWVHFMMNEKSGGNFSKARRIYHPDSCMNVIELVKTLEEEGTKRKAGQPNIFDNNHQIIVTAFVDEYYYEKHPLTNETTPNLWKQFVDQPRRVMHILSAVKRSSDGASSEKSTSISIQQKAIQTIYNVHDKELTSAWGCEVEDENSELWAYTSKSYSAPTAEDRGNNSPYNGRLNSCKEWGLIGANATALNSSTHRWDKYINFDANNETPQLHDSYQSMRYSCMTRNRDNNGNGYIEADEIRWYMASIRQLIGLWMGDNAVNQVARLYTKTGKESGHNWRQHVVSSTQSGTNSNDPTVVWGEEGSSTGALSGSIKWGTGEVFLPIFSVRCVRNLGVDPGSDNLDITYSELDVTPTDYCEVTGNANDGYIINMRHLHKDAIRYTTINELEHTDENSVQNLLPPKFEVAGINKATTFSPGDADGNGTSNTIADLNDYLNVPTNKNNACPEGYRLPNQRELTLMHYYTTGIMSGTNFCRTFYSFGARANAGYKITSEANKVGWAYNSDRIFLAEISNHTSTSQRCVRDIEE